MDVERLREAWQTQDVQSADMDADKAVRMILRKGKKLENGALWSDIVDSVIALVVAAAYIWIGHNLSQNLWPSYLAAACFCWAPVFLIVGRRTQPALDTGATMKVAIEQQLLRVERQIRLLRGVAWWGLLPCTLGMMLILVDLGSQIHPDFWTNPPRFFLVMVLLIAVLNLGIYWLNQVCVKKVLLPHRQELESALRETETDELGQTRSLV